MIEIEHLWKFYHESQPPAVADLTLTVERGEIFGLLGPNGAGKTTTLRILATMLQPSRGTIRVGNHDIRYAADQVRRTIGFVSNNTAIYDRMTAWETVEYFGRLFGMSRHDLRRRMEGLFDQLQMQSFRDVPGAKMSTGMKQKVSIARALVHDPPVLVFDEPTLGLDVLAARALLEIIEQLREAGKCILFSTHIMREVEKLCDRVAIMHRGRVLAEGTVSSLSFQYDRPDFEDVFFHLIDQADSQINSGASLPATPASRGA